VVVTDSVHLFTNQIIKTIVRKVSCRPVSKGSDAVCLSVSSPVEMDSLPVSDARRVLVVTHSRLLRVLALILIDRMNQTKRRRQDRLRLVPRLLLFQKRIVAIGKENALENRVVNPVIHAAPVGRALAPGLSLVLLLGLPTIHIVLIPVARSFDAALISEYIFSIYFKFSKRIMS
jgi:hypothetical protein